MRIRNTVFGKPDILSILIPYPVSVSGASLVSVDGMVRVSQGALKDEKMKLFKKWNAEKAM